MKNDMKLIMESFDKYINEDIKDPAFAKLIQSMKDNIEDIKQKQGSKEDLSESLTAAGLIWAVISVGSGIGAVGEFIMEKVQEYEKGLRKNLYGELEGREMTLEKWSRIIKEICREIKRGFATLGGHTFAKYLGPLWNLFATDNAKKKLDKFADIMSIIVAVVVVIKLGFVKAIKGTLKNMDAISAVAKSIVDTMALTGKGLVQWVVDIFKVIGGATDTFEAIKESVKAIRQIWGNI